jgi:adenine-specific DNA-methyltransferase
MQTSTMDGKTFDIVAENIQKLKSLFPEIVTEDKIDFEKLQAILGEYIDTDNERYNFTWHGKSKALRLSQTPSTGTLRPCKEESKDWDTTQNLYIEGDNLEVLKLLQKTYHNKVKMIYIDPPYNTGNDFVYPDNFQDNLQNYLEITKQVDGTGRKVSTNSDKNGRYHTDWLNMIYPRLRLARNLLTDDGVIFISIDDNEVDNLNKVCNEIFGEENYVATIVWQRAFSPKNDSRFFSTNHDYLLVISKSMNNVKIKRLARTDETLNRYTNADNDPRGVWTSGDLSVKTYSEKYDYSITTPSGRIVNPPHGSCWRVSKERFNELKADNRIWFGADGNNVPRLKRFLSEVQEGMVPITIWLADEVGHNQDGRQELKRLFDDKGYFDGPKPVSLIIRSLMLITDEDSIILDFFSGSATTAHAVMQLNAEDGGNRKSIMVQLPESCAEDTEAYKVGYKNICEIGKERIRRAGEKIKTELQERQSTQISLIKDEKTVDPENLDIGFKVFKLDSSNLKKWNPDYDNLESSLDEMLSNYVDGRSELDVVYEIMLKYGIDLTLPVEERDFNGKKVYVIRSIDTNTTVICLYNEITTDIAGDILKLKKELAPEIMRVVFKDNGFRNDAAKTNVIEMLKQGGVEEFVTV